MKLGFGSLILINSNWDVSCLQYETCVSYWRHTSLCSDAPLTMDIHTAGQTWKSESTFLASPFFKFSRAYIYNAPYTWHISTWRVPIWSSKQHTIQLSLQKANNTKAKAKVEVEIIWYRFSVLLMILIFVWVPVIQLYSVPQSSSS